MWRAEECFRSYLTQALLDTVSDGVRSEAFEDEDDFWDGLFEPSEDGHIPSGISVLSRTPPLES